MISRRSRALQEFAIDRALIQIRRNSFMLEEKIVIFCFMNKFGLGHTQQKVCRLFRDRFNEKIPRYYQLFLFHCAFYFKGRIINEYILQNAVFKREIHYWYLGLILVLVVHRRLDFFQCIEINSISNTVLDTNAQRYRFLSSFVQFELFLFFVLIMREYASQWMPIILSRKLFF